jgi:glycosyltransferase involved in cell wall biosynthesis
MKIGVCIDFFFDTVAGAESHSAEVAHELRRLGHEVEIIASRTFLSPRIPPDTSFTVRTTPGLYILREYSRIMPTKWLSVLLYHIPGWIFGLKSAQILQRYHYDVVYAFSYDLLRAVIRHDVPTPIVFTIHDPIWPTNAPLLKRANKITCAGTVLQEEIKRENNLDTIFIPPAVDMERFHQLTAVEKAAFRAALELSPQDRLLLYANRLIPKKNCEILLQAMPAIIGGEPKAKLLVLGQGVSARKLKRLVTKLGIERHVHFYGLVPNEAVNSYFNIADLVVVPSLYETCSEVSVQALAVGRPLLVSSNLKEFCRHFPDVTTADPASAEEFAEKSLALLCSPVQVDVKNLRLFDVQHIAKQYEELLYEAVSQATTNTTARGG